MGGCIAIRGTGCLDSDRPLIFFDSKDDDRATVFLDHDTFSTSGVGFSVIYEHGVSILSLLLHVDRVIDRFVRAQADFCLPELPALTDVCHSRLHAED